MKSEVFNIDNMVGMAQYPDNYFELALIDPPYGIGESGGDKKRNRKYNRIVKHTKKDWDSQTPNQAYFSELRRVSKNQVIWGANYLIDKIQTPTMGWIFWDKRIGGDFSDGELAWTSFNRALRMFSYSHVGDTRGGHDRIHPTQKPVPLYEWILKNYAKEGDKILDTHVGSGSSRIAAYKMGFDFTGFELDEEYFNASVKRFNEFKSQLTLAL
jgi:site-specific DNA-methyltransferase (adenine-specific)